MTFHGIVQSARYQLHLVNRYLRICAIADRRPLRIYYGCGNVRQPGYINVDIRLTPAVDLLGDLGWCARRLTACCSEVYLSHVLEHFASPGKAMRDQPDTVIGALKQVFRMLEPGGTIRVAVPDFGVISRLYIDGNQPLYPRLLGRVCGEQNYPENVHRCVFDRKFLERCLTEAGFVDLQTWDPQVESLDVDASFDEIDGVLTSLNLKGFKRCGRV